VVESLKKYNHTTYAILGILTTDCKSGYAIKQMIDQSLHHFWKISYGQIYPTLKLIEEEGLATVETSSQVGKPDRNEYTLTAKGIDALKDWLRESIEQVPAERNEILLKLFFGRHESIETNVMHLEDYKRNLEVQIHTYKAIIERISAIQDEQADAKYWLLTLDYGVRTTKAAIDWCEASIQLFEEE
jgi:PadR family transcriptional regulator AphA